MGVVGALPGAYSDFFSAQVTHDKASGTCGCDIELGSMSDTLGYAGLAITYRLFGIGGYELLVRPVAA